MPMPRAAAALFLPPALLLPGLWAAPASGVTLGTTEALSRTPVGGVGNGFSSYPAMTPDGTYVAFSSLATDLTSGDVDGHSDVFVRNVVTGTTTLVSVAASGGSANGASYRPTISDTGRFVAFTSKASNLTAGDTNAHEDVFVRDTKLGSTQRISVATSGAQADADSERPVISGDASTVAFLSLASNLVPGDRNSVQDVFVWKRLAKTLRLVSASSTGQPGNGESGVYSSPSLDLMGGLVAFTSAATNLVPGDTNHKVDLFVRDLATGLTDRESVGPTGTQGNGLSYDPVLTPDGLHLGYYSYATNLAANDVNGHRDVFVRDRTTGVSRLVSVTPSGAQGNDDSYRPALSADARYVAFFSKASNLVPGDTNGLEDVFLRDTRLGTTWRVSVSVSGGNSNAGTKYAPPVIDAAGTTVVFASPASNLVRGDTNGTQDVFLRKVRST